MVDPNEFATLDDFKTSESVKDLAFRLVGDVA